MFEPFIQQSLSLESGLYTTRIWIGSGLRVCRIQHDTKKELRQLRQRRLQNLACFGYFMTNLFEGKPDNQYYKSHLWQYKMSWLHCQ